MLEGSLRRSGDQLRITVQLIAADTGLHIWSRSFDLPIGDIFQIEDTVSRAVAEALHLTLSAETAELWAQRQPEKMEALELYLLGRARQSRRTAEDNLKSMEYFRRAVDADPQYVPALVGLAESLLNGLSLNRAPLEDVKAEVEPLINRAMQINPNLPEVLAVKGWLLTEEFRFDEALPLLLRATQLNPNDASSHRFLGNLYDRRAQPGEAHEAFFGGREPRSDGFHLARVPLHGARGSRRIRRSHGRLRTRARARPDQHVGAAGHRVDLARAGQDRRGASSGSTRRASCSRRTPISPTRRSSCCWRRGRSPRRAR